MHPATRHRSASRLVLVLLAVVALVAGACSSASSTPAPTPVPTGPLELAGTNWLLIKYLSPGGAVFTVPMSVTPTAQFTADQMSGNSGCNTFNGPYTLGAGNAKDGQELTLGPMTSTMMACQEPMLGVETAYLAALDVVDKAALLEGGELQLWDSGGKTTLVFLKGS
jgi:heat shock protein HslJ